MSALFDFNAFLTVVLLTICTCAYVKMRAPGILSERTGCVFFGARRRISTPIEKNDVFF